jgi:hypothetical protein
MREKRPYAQTLTSTAIDFNFLFLARLMGGETGDASHH